LRLIVDVWMSRSAIPARRSAATTADIRVLLSRIAAEAVADWVTTPAENIAMSGVRRVSPSALMLSTVLAGRW
jgi:hypothetical protein